MARRGPRGEPQFAQGGAAGTASKTIRSQWKEWKDGGILILHAQEGKDWLLQPLSSASGKATVVLYNDMTQYQGTPLD